MIKQRKAVPKYEQDFLNTDCSLIVPIVAVIWTVVAPLDI